MSRSCKKTHKRVLGECVPNNVVHKTKYARIKKKIKKRAKRKGQRWGAYTSGNLVQAYKRAGGKYKGRKRTFGTKKRRKTKRKSRRRKSRRRKSKRRKSRRKTRRKSRRKTRRKSRRSYRVGQILARSVRNVGTKVPRMVVRAKKPSMRDVTNMNDAKAKKFIEKAKDAYELDDKHRENVMKLYNMKVNPKEHAQNYEIQRNMRTFRINT